MGLRLRRLVAVEGVQAQAWRKGLSDPVNAGAFQVKERAGEEREAHWFSRILQFISRGRLAVMLIEIKLQCSSLAKAHPGSCNLFTWPYVFVKFGQ